jgi:homoaconitase/3-isopropylmalate dehydratase large subunit
MKRAAKLYHRMQLVPNTTSVERINALEERDEEVVDADQEAVLSEHDKSVEEKVSNQLVRTCLNNWLFLNLFLLLFIL